jgi:SAM-dependent methyltransferase
MDRAARLSDTKRSWNVATRAHDAHKLDQADFLANGGSTLFAEERELLGSLSGKRLLHTLCNSGQDSLSLAALGAEVVGVDLSDVAVGLARNLSRQSGIHATFHESEILEFLEGELEPRPFDLAFGSYGCLPWIEDLARYFRGIARRLVPHGRVVIVEFHPMAWSFDAELRLKDPYFAPGRLFSDPVSDYVAEALGALSPSGHLPSDVKYDNPHPAHSFQHTVADIVTAAIQAGLELEQLREWPYSNGCRVCPALIASADDPWRFVTSEGVPNIPLMLGLSARLASRATP